MSRFVAKRARRSKANPLHELFRKRRDNLEDTPGERWEIEARSAKHRQGRNEGHETHPKYASLVKKRCKSTRVDNRAVQATISDERFNRFANSVLSPSKTVSLRLWPISHCVLSCSSLWQLTWVLLRSARTLAIDLDRYQPIFASSAAHEDHLQVYFTGIHQDIFRRYHGQMYVSLLGIPGTQPRAIGASRIRGSRAVEFASRASIDVKARCAPPFTALELCHAPNQLCSRAADALFVPPLLFAAFCTSAYPIWSRLDFAARGPQK